MIWLALYLLVAFAWYAGFRHEGLTVVSCLLWGPMALFTLLAVIYLSFTTSEYAYGCACPDCQTTPFRLAEQLRRDGHQMPRDQRWIVKVFG